MMVYYRCSSLTVSCGMWYLPHLRFYFFLNDTATTEIYTLSLHDALPISAVPLRTVPRAELLRYAGESQLLERLLDRRAPGACPCAEAREGLRRLPGGRPGKLSYEIGRAHV